MNKQVNVLVSTYNGEKYVAMQLDSILAQTYKNIKIYVRDDGSADNTLSILEGYENRAQITLIKGENLGFCGSFMELLRIADDGEYWAFSDQDDIWLPDKLMRAMEWLNEQDEQLPLLFHGAYADVNEEGTPTGVEYLPPKKPFVLRRAMTENIISGFSMVINSKLREMMFEFDQDILEFHDWLAGAIAVSMGRMQFDDVICAYHRRLDTSITKASLIKKIKWTLRSLTKDSYMVPRNRGFFNAYGERLSSEDKKLEPLFKEKGKRLKKAFYPKRWRYKVMDELVVRTLMLFGRI